MITRARAVQILQEHGTGPNIPTAWFPEENNYDPTSTFDEIVGVKEEYQFMEVLGFLGYCCPHC